MSRAGPALVLVLCVVRAGALHVRVNGDVLFALHLSEEAQWRLAHERQALASPAPRATPSPSDPTAPTLACRFHFPEQEQVEAILSNMMNELTKVFVRANLFLKSENSTRQSGVWRAEEEVEGSSTTRPLEPTAAAVPSPSSSGGSAVPPSRRSAAAAVPSSASLPTPFTSPSLPPSPSAQMTTPAARSNRFKVVNSKNTQFFEHIFHNMTEEFSTVFNGSQHVARARRDPCRQQDAVRRAWRDLLRRSLAAFRRAAINCVKDYLKIQECEQHTKARLVRFLVRELDKMRARHLQLLCDRFQLCLDEELLADAPATPRTSDTPNSN